MASFAFTSKLMKVDAQQVMQQAGEPYLPTPPAPKLPWTALPADFLDSNRERRLYLLKNPSYSKCAMSGWQDIEYWRNAKLLKEKKPSSRRMKFKSADIIEDEDKSEEDEGDKGKTKGRTDQDQEEEEGASSSED
ncbi:hypothetical protein E1B28_009365 [Marasmius oreades]|uniref:Uncharacterized protein n=1 Tax=Marasmius oreades TaxID=181124 RepID=A0A9P7S0I9_9AGAR|nr:uncharacterized protein E1B28_009365 [Marasmius oreades]KAG7093075.1 hypothetical protein E1B28_009365 [Marasmius oreades]